VLYDSTSQTPKLFLEASKIKEFALPGQSFAFLTISDCVNTSYKHADYTALVDYYSEVSGRAPKSLDLVFAKPREHTGLH